MLLENIVIKDKTENNLGKSVDFSLLFLRYPVFGSKYSENLSSYLINLGLIQI